MASSDFYPITGIKTDDGDIPIRRDVNDWYLEQTGKDGNRIQLTLFVEALIKIQARPLDDELSYFRLAAIHGAPWISWDNVSPQKNGPKPENFCVHNDYTFPTWHRVYMLLFEQVIYDAMIEHIDGFSNESKHKKSVWKKEAGKWRLPYWDFARFARKRDGTSTEELRLPLLAMMPQVMIKALGSTELVSKPNPLYRFETQKLMGQLEQPYTITDQVDTQDGKVVTIPFGQCKSTTKYGLMQSYNSEVWVDAGQNWQLANIALNEHPWYQHKPGEERIPNLQDMIFRLLTNDSKTWSEFSTTKDVGKHDKPSVWMNLEGIHNNVHNWVGGFLFDRSGRDDDLKIWGSGHMSCVPVAAFDPIFWLHHCNIDRLTAIWQYLNPEKWFNDISKPWLSKYLTPFHKDEKGKLFTSKDVQDWRSLGYEYSITKKGRTSHDIINDIIELYGNQTVIPYNVPNLGSSDNKGDYILSIKYNRYALGGSPFQISIFFGDVDDNDFYDTNSKNFIGSVFNFSTDTQGSSCANCIQQQQDEIGSVCQLPATLAVYNYLSEKREYPKLHYVVVNSRGKPVDVKADIALHASTTWYSDHPTGRRGQGDYSKIVDGVPATVKYY
ncbi:tyrosinase domain protein [Annulohypoxylon nitens]|nr:tyrosinase domain protein [Annulohypoxylon nitens]